MTNYGKSNIKIKINHFSNFLLVDETSLELRDLVQFKNGATYEGQWLGNMKHGHGT